MNCSLCCFHQAARQREHCDVEGGGEVLEGKCTRSKIPSSDTYLSLQLNHTLRTCLPDYDLLEDNNAKETKEKTSCSRVNNINTPNLSRDRLTTQICPSRVAPNPNPNNMTTCCLLLAHLSEYTKVLLVLYLYQSR